MGVWEEIERMGHQNDEGVKGDANLKGKSGQVENFDECIDNEDDSSCEELTPEQIQAWLSCCQKQPENNLDTRMVDQKEDQWGSWEQIVQQFKKKNSDIDVEYDQRQQIFNNMKPIEHYHFQQSKNKFNDFVSDPVEEYLMQNNQDIQFSEKQETQDSDDCIWINNEVYGPYKIRNQNYRIYLSYQMKLVQQIKSKSQIHLLGSDQLKMIQDNCQNLRQINWEIKEEKKAEVKWSRMRKLFPTYVIEYGVDFFIHDHVAFVKNPLNEGTHAYFGIRMLGDFSDSVSSKSLGNGIDYRKDYLFLPSTGECLLETVYNDFEIKNPLVSVQTFDIILSLTQEKIATCERIIQLERGDKKETTYIRAYDKFEQKYSQYLGIIQSKISQFHGQYYCNTNILIPKCVQPSKKNLKKQTHKLIPKLRLSETGCIVAQLGIYKATSSITNCIMFNKQKQMHFMMAALKEGEDEVDIVARVGGISPLVGFVGAVARNLFVYTQ